MTVTLFPDPLCREWRSWRLLSCLTWLPAGYLRPRPPGKRLLIVRRMDYVYGDYSLEFEVDGKKAGVCECPGTDRINRWRNWPHIVPAEFVVRAEPNVKQIAVTAGRDINMFRYWFYQPRQ